MPPKLYSEPNPSVDDFLKGKSSTTLNLFQHFVKAFEKVGAVSLVPTKSMIGIATPSGKKIAWITQLGKNFVHVVFPFEEAYHDNLCFQKIAQVPGHVKQFNHHFRLLAEEDLNEEVVNFMRLAYSVN